MMIKIINFTKEHIVPAIKIAENNYENERKHVTILPFIKELPNFSPFTENGLGVSAFDEEKMVGYLCCISPYKYAFKSTNAIGVWSPIYGNGIIEGNKNIYARMYQEAAKKWVDAGATSHSISFYAHNYDIQNQLYRYGFGLRCIDAIRPMEEININQYPNILFKELDNNEFQSILPLNKLLVNYLENSPMFMRYLMDDNEYIRELMKNNIRYFVAKADKKIIAYIKISDEGENFVCEVNDMKNICGAYCLPEYRGQGIFQNLLNYLIKKLKDEKYLRLGVDFESFNPAGSGFWQKYFTEYTQGVVRRIDDRFIDIQC
jgi:GNAT superfamily N-acetyltransferase